MAAFCTCCGEVITAKSVACMACGAPSHGMKLKVAKVSATANDKSVSVEALPVRIDEVPLRASLTPGCCAA